VADVACTLDTSTHACTHGHARFGSFLASVGFDWVCVCGVLQDAKAQGDGIFLIRCIADLKVQPNAMGKLIVQRYGRQLCAHARAHTHT
jgi:hypothetical protein